MSLLLRGLATANTPHNLPQDRALALAQAINNRKPEFDTWITDIYRHSGIQNRTVSVSDDVVKDFENGTNTTCSPFLLKGPDDFQGPTTAERMEIYWQFAAPMALEAAEAALVDARIPAKAVTHLIVVTCTGFRAPGIDSFLMAELPLDPAVERTQVGFMGCQGAFNGLRVAKAFTGSDPKAVVLMVAVEVSSVHYHYGREAKKLVGNALFADGAAALVATAAKADEAGWRLKATGSHRLPDTEGAMSWTMGNHGFEMELSPKIPGLIATHLPGWIDAWLAKQGLNRSQVRSWALHPGGPKILSVIQESLGLAKEQTAVSWEVLAGHGNMSSATVLFLMNRLRKRNAPRPCVAIGFGPGMFVEGMLWE